MRRWGSVAGMVCAAGLCATMWGLGGKAAPQHKVELTPWELAERGLETLQGISEGARTRADYARAMDGFRAVYHGAPGDVHAPNSVNAVAELLAEQGRALHDAKSLKDAVGQYEFLRMQYPASSLRVAALLAQGQIYENDLKDAAAARETIRVVGEGVSAEWAGRGGQGGDCFFGARKGGPECGWRPLRRSREVQGAV